MTRMKWVDLLNLSKITQIESYFPKVLGSPTKKFMDIISHFNFGMLILWSKPTGV